MKITDLIACFIRETLEKMDGVAELSRSELAKQFRCSPSQINYVIATRFSPERGYLLESRRGGGGYIRLMQISNDCDSMATHVLGSIGTSIDPLSVRAIVANLQATGVLTLEQARMIETATSEAALRPSGLHGKDALRASIFKHMLLQIICLSKEGKAE
ncbi:MAG: CtsR family transcriptional regulator [Oscillospiraceae bacterium]|jgi:transcriptional regulator CtsR